VLEHIATAKKLMQANGFKGEIFVYVLLTDDINESFRRIMVLDYLGWENGCRTNKVKLFAQQYIEFKEKKQIPQWQSDMARWCVT